MSAKWRLLDENEPRQPGDELYMAQWSCDVWTPWAPDLNKPIDHLLARRRMTPAEEHAEEVLSALGDLIEKAIPVVNPRSIFGGPSKCASPPAIMAATEALEAAGIAFDKAKAIS